MKTNSWRVLLLLIVTTAVQTAKADFFTNTGSLNIARIWHTATLLPNGQVLVAGGVNGNSRLSSAELYNPANGTWTMTNPMHRARVFHTATLLTNGQVLIVGGYNNADGYLSSVEIYNPTNGAWSMANSLPTPSEGHTATLLTNGEVLVAGGFYTNTPSGGSLARSSAEIYDPVAGTWTVTGSLNIARGGHTATLLRNGQVLVVGGVITSNYLTIPISSAELYDPANGTWMVITNSVDLARYNHTATLLSNGQVLVAGGSGNNGTFSSAELFNPSNMTWKTVASMTTARQNHTATLLPDGRVLVAGGGNSSGNLSSAELFDPATGIWTNTGTMTTTCEYQTATLLTNGQVLFAGGMDNSGNDLTSAEIYYLASGTILPSITAPTMLSTGQFQFSFETTTGMDYGVQYSTNLTQWFPFVTLGGTCGTLTLIDPNTSGSQQRFYRIILSPQ